MIEAQITDIACAALYVLETSIFCHFRCNVGMSIVIIKELEKTTEFLNTGYNFMAISRLRWVSDLSIVYQKKIKSTSSQSKFKKALTEYLIATTFYSLGEFLEHSIQRCQS
ncbi:hypothetical protein J6590_069855 [Homalodisca vitripennis]|nr:hypothetical protein J6590_069855 [Homalodisca vitripennis]